jgi:type VI secretion system protein ImpL
MDSARLVFDPAPAGQSGVLQAHGPWALFRLFDRGNLSEAGSPDRYTLTFRQGDREAEFEVDAASVLNPFVPGVLQSFRCPGL